jgi:hypothetical protein
MWSDIFGRVRGAGLADCRALAAADDRKTLPKILSKFAANWQHSKITHLCASAKAPADIFSSI